MSTKYGVTSEDRKVTSKVTGNGVLPVTEFDDIWRRIEVATGATTHGRIAEILGVSRQTVSAAYKRKSVPFPWLIKISKETGISIDWLLFGEGPKYRGEKTEEKIVKISEKIDTSLVKEVVQTVEEFLQEQSISLSPAKKAELIALIIEEIQDYDRKPSEERILRLIKLAS